MWVIALGVITVVTVFFAFLTTQKLSETEEARQRAVQAAQNAESAQRAEIDKLAAVSEVVGFKDTGAGAKTNPAAVRSQLEEIAATFPSVDSGTATLSAAIPPILADYNGLSQQTRDLTQQVAQLRNDLAARQNELRSSIAQKDETIASLTRELEDTRTSLNTQVADLERQRDAGREQIRDLERQVAEANSTADASQRELAGEIRQLGDRNTILSERLNGVQRAAQEPDARITGASQMLGKAWFDRGRLDRVHAGMEFEVVDRRSGKVKGRIKVIDVQDEMSEARVLVEDDRYNPIAAQDFVRNALYDPDRMPIAVLLGNGFGKYSENDMRNLLVQVGVEVRGDINPEVDYLILGTPFFDPDTGDVVPFESFDPYKEAESLSVQIVPMRDVMAWLGF